MFKAVLCFAALIVLLVIVLVLGAIAGPNAFALGINAEADVRGISISTSPEMECRADGQAAAPMGYTPWDHEVVWGKNVLVQCWYPGTTGFLSISTRIWGQAFLPLEMGG